MDQTLRRIFSVFLLLFLLVCAFPGATFADEEVLEGGDKVLTEVSHSAALEAIDVSGKTEVELTVPFDAKENIDLSKGLTLSYNKSLYTSAVAQFPDGAEAVVDGAPVKMQIVYQKKDHEDFYQTQYLVTVVRAPKVEAEFSGTIEKSVTAPATFSLKEADFANQYVKHDGGELNYIILEGATPSFGLLKLSGKEYTAGDKVTLADLKKSALTFTATAGGEVSYLVTAYSADDTKANGTAVLKITSQANQAKEITLETRYNTPLKFTVTPFQTVCKTVTGENLAYVNFELPSNSYGKLYYRYTSAGKYDSTVSATKNYYRNGTPDLAQVSFVPKNGYTGKVTIPYTGYSESGRDYEGKLVITVEKAGDKIIAYKVSDRRVCDFSSSDFNRVCETFCGDSLAYVTFSQPSSSIGRLYYNYDTSSEDLVSSSTKYYRSGSPTISKVSFVPKAGYNGTATITYRAHSTNGDVYEGTVEITVSKSRVNNLEYQTAHNTPLTFSASDFNDLCKEALGTNLSYVKFSLPSSNYGRLYYDYKSSTGKYEDAVSSGDKYYRSGTPSLSKVTFVPKDGYHGTVTLSFTMYSTNGDSYSGKAEIAVSDVISYRSRNGNVVPFDAADFNDSCRGVTGSTLSYVKFVQPSASAGKLYYDYISGSRYDSVVSSNTKYYRNSQPALSKITFVPRNGYEGTVTIDYIGYAVNGNRYDGQIKVVVSDNEQQQNQNNNWNHQGGNATKHFKDVGPNYEWARASIERLYEKGIVKGISDELYQPQADITRGDFILMLYRAFDFKIQHPAQVFRDIPQTSIYYDAVNTAKYLGIAKGDGNRFRPNDLLSREDAMVLVMRTMEVVGSAPSLGSSRDLAGFVDRNQVAGYAVEPVAGLVKANLIAGSNGNRLQPKSHMTRAEMAVFLDRVVED